MLLGGGGYTIRNVARCWTYETAVALGTEIANELPYNDYFEYFGPDFKLHISPSNMTNQNTTEYMDKIKYVLIQFVSLTHNTFIKILFLGRDYLRICECFHTLLVSRWPPSRRTV